MNERAIIYPCLALVLLTMMVWFCMAVRRGMHMRTHSIKPNDMPSRVEADAKFGASQAPNNNLMNLFELPVLFYVLAILLIQTQMGDIIYVVASWLFVALRAGQSAVHVTYNNVLHRGLFYLASAGILWLMWIRFAYQFVSA